MIKNKILTTAIFSALIFLSTPYSFAGGIPAYFPMGGFLGIGISGLPTLGPTDIRHTIQAQGAWSVTPSDSAAVRSSSSLFVSAEHSLTIRMGYYHLLNPRAFIGVLTELVGPTRQDTAHLGRANLTYTNTVVGSLDIVGGVRLGTHRQHLLYWMTGYSAVGQNRQIASLANSFVLSKAYIMHSGVNIGFGYTYRFVRHFSLSLDYMLALYFNQKVERYTFENPAQSIVLKEQHFVSNIAVVALNYEI